MSEKGPNKRERERERERERVRTQDKDVCRNVVSDREKILEQRLAAE